MSLEISSKEILSSNGIFPIFKIDYIIIVMFHETNKNNEILSLLHIEREINFDFDIKSLINLMLSIYFNSFRKIIILNVKLFIKFIYFLPHCFIIYITNYFVAEYYKMINI